MLKISFEMDQTWLIRALTDDIFDYKKIMYATSYYDCLIIIFLFYNI